MVEMKLGTIEDTPPSPVFSVNLNFNFEDNDGLTKFGTVCLMIVGWL